MVDERYIRLATYHRLLKGQLALFRKAAKSKDGLIERTAVDFLDHQLKGIESDFPNFLLPFHSYAFSSYSKYRAGDICTFLVSAIASIQAAVQVHRELTALDACDFSFMNNSGLRGIVERDYLEIHRVNQAQGWKSMIILCGGTIEAILTDLLLANEMAAKSSPKKPSHKSNISRWELAELIDVAGDLKLVKTGFETLSQAVRKFRNLVHPGMELREGLSFHEHEALIAYHTLRVLIRELSGL
jgi:hypothetical protein